MSLPLPPHDRSEAWTPSMLDDASAPAHPVTSSTAWASSYTRRPRRAATIPVESQAWSLPCDDLWSSPKQIHNRSSSSQHHQQSAMTKNAAVSRPYPVSQEQQRQSSFEHDLEYHPRRSVYDRRQQEKAQYQAYRPNFQAVDYQQQASHQQQQSKQSFPWPATPPPALQMRRGSSRTLAPTTVPEAPVSATDLANRSFSISRSAVTGVKGLGSLLMEGGEGESGRATPAVAMVVFMDPSGNRELQRYSGSTLGGYNRSSTYSRASVSKGLLAPPVVAGADDTVAAERHHAERRRFRIMASLGTLSAIATVVLAVFTALSFYSKAQA